MKKFFLFVTMALMMLSVAFAASEAADIAEVTQVEIRDELVATGSTVDVEAGNITVANIEANRSTYRWGAVIGNATGNILLGDETSGAVLHVWAANAIAVYASEGTGMDWGVAFTAAAESDMPAYIQSATDSDDFDSTFAEGPAAMAGTTLTATSGVSVQGAITKQGDGADGWTTFAYRDSGDTMNIFGVQVNDGVNSYADDDVDFQILLPEDGTGSDTAVTAYNVWIELQ